MSEPTCPYCGDGMESVGTLNHIECVRALVAERDSKEREYHMVLGSVSLWVNSLHEGFGAAIDEGRELARAGAVGL